MKNYNMKKLIGRMIIVIAASVFLVSILMFLLGGDLTEAIDVIKTADVKYLLIALGLMLLYFILYPATLLIYNRGIRQKYDTNIVDDYLISNSEHFFNGITPSATGGQPFQVYAYNKIGVKTSDSTGTIMLNLITFLLGTNIFAAISLVFYNEYTSAIEDLRGIIVVAFLMNFFPLCMFFGLSCSKKAKNVVLRFLVWLTKFRLFNKFLGSKISSFDEYFTDAQSAFKKLIANKSMFISCLLIKLLTLAIFYITPFFILKSFNSQLSYNDLFYVLCGSSFACTMVAWLPTPGGTGGMELAFQSIFITIVGMNEAATLGGVIIWRLLSYYLIITISFIAYIIFEKRNQAKHEMSHIENNDEGVLNDNEEKSMEEEKAL